MILALIVLLSFTIAGVHAWASEQTEEARLRRLTQDLRHRIWRLRVVGRKERA